MDYFNNNIFGSADGAEKIHKEPDDTDLLTGGFTLVMFNDDEHSFEEVILQVMKATGFTPEKATAITFEAHNSGKASVVTGDLNKCIKAQGVLEEIGLGTSIEVNS